MDSRLVTLCLIYAASATEKADELLLPAVYREVGLSFGVPPSALGSLTFVRALVQAAFFPVAATLVAFMPRVWVVGIGAAAWGLATLGVGLSRTYWQVAAWRAFNGAGLALVIPAIQSLVADSAHGSSRGLAFGNLQLITNLGGLLGSLLGVTFAPHSFLEGSLDGWRVSFLILAALSFAVAVLVLLFARDPAPVTLHSSSLSTASVSAAAGTAVQSMKQSVGVGGGGSAAVERQRLMGGEEGDIGLTDVRAGDDAVHGLRKEHSTPLPSFSARSALTALSTLLADFLTVARIPTFIFIVLQGIVGSFAWASLSFFAMWFELRGFSHVATAALVSVFALTTCFGGLFGGWLGDRLAATHPNSGRILCSQISSGSAAVLSVLLLRGIPNGPFAFAALMLFASIMGFMVSWNAPATNNPIFAELVPEAKRTNVYALDRTIEVAFSSLAPPAVGLLAERWFGYIPPPPKSLLTNSQAGGAPALSPASLGIVPSDQETDAANAEALSKGLCVAMVIPFILCCSLYGFLYRFYPRDRDAVRQAAAAKEREEEAERLRVDEGSMLTGVVRLRSSG